MADDQVADDQVADGQAPDDLTQGVRVCVANLTKVTDELSDAVKVKDEERAKLTEKIESLEYAAISHARGMAELEEARVSITITMVRSKRQAAELKACEGELAASKQKVTALEAQLALRGEGVLGAKYDMYGAGYACVASPPAQPPGRKRTSSPAPNSADSAAPRCGLKAQPDSTE